MSKGGVKVEEVAVNDHLDKEFKPGLHLQVNRFLSGLTDEMCSLEQQIDMWPFYEQMAGYSSSNTKRTD
jgi:hypothetical protein